MLPLYVPKIIAVDYMAEGVIITFDNGYGALFPASLLYKTMLVSNLPQLSEPAKNPKP
jgi:hypothetical protein